jgi:CubicO group peptidase (beta-lactamase class C family)
MSNSGKLKKYLLRGTLILVAAAVIAGALNYNRLVRLNRAVSLFNEDEIDENFRSMDRLFDSTVVKSGESIHRFSYDLKDLPQHYTYKGEKKKTADFIESTHTTGLIVLKDNTIKFEKYYRGNSESSRAISWSVSKSIVSALFGIAVQEGHIKSIEDTVTDYVPYLKGSGYDGVRIKDVLQMSSGIRFNEDYGDFNSDINRMGRDFALNRPLKNFIASLKSDRKPGTYNHYVSMDTQVLGMIIVAATGKSLTEYTEEKLWKPLGMEADAAWLADSEGMETAFGGFNAVLRDYARFGRLFLKKGKWDKRQIVPEKWVKDSTTPDAPHLMPGENPASGWVLGYGYQWWIPENPDGEFMAIGIYGQAIYIYPRYNIVIVKTSAYPDYNAEGSAMELESIEFFRAIAKGI